MCINKYSDFLKIAWQIRNVCHVGLVSFLQLVQTNVPNAQAKNHQDMKNMIPVDVDTVINPIF